MDSVTINWQKGVIRFADLGTSLDDYLDGSGFYAVVAGKYDQQARNYTGIKLLYIGQAFDQTLRERIPQPHDAYTCVNQYLKNHPGTTPLAMLGAITSASVERVTQQFVDDTECCLIFSNQPSCNTSCRDSYSGRSIRITNTGDFWPLKETSSCGGVR
jgi:hypothetical protein